jgi:hypothetical protein
MDVNIADIDMDGDNDVVGIAYFGNEIKWWENKQPVGNITGSVSPAFSGITIDLLDDQNTLIQSTLTDEDGFYEFPDLEPSNYVVTLVEPLGYTVDQNDVPVSLEAGETDTVNFELSPIITTNNARSKGYWKHQVKANQSGKGNHDYTTEELEGFANDIFSHFYGNPINPIAVEGVTYVNNPPGALDIDDLEYMLTINQGGSTMYERACQQYLALLLNVTSDKLAQYADASEDGATVSQAIVYINDLLGTEDELAKDIAETLNQGELVETGNIPLTTPNVIFSDEVNEMVAMGPLSFPLSSAYPNPFTPPTTLTYSLPTAAPVTLSIYDIRGQLVTTLVDGHRDAGIHEVVFDASGLASGIYLAHIEAGSRSSVQKLMLLK